MRNPETDELSPRVVAVRRGPDQKRDTQPDAKLRFQVSTGFAVAIVLTCLLGFLSWRMAQQANEDAQWVARTHEVSTSLEATLRALVDVETGVRGFALTGHEPFLQPYRSGVAAVRQDLRQLRILLLEKNQRQRLDILEKQSNALLAAAAHVVATRRDTGASLGPSDLEHDKQLMDAARMTVAAMQDAQTHLLQERSARARATQRFQLTLIVLGAVAAVIFLALAAATVSREIAVSARARAQVIDLNMELERRVEQRTAALKAEIAMREHLAAVVASSGDAIASKDLDGTITAWNGGAEKIFGYTASEAVGQSMRMLFPLDQVEEESNILARIRNGDSVEHFETVRVRKDGTPIDVSVAISPIRDATGAIVGASNIARDITRRKQVESALMRSQQELENQKRMLQSILDSMVEGLVAADQQGNFIIWNPAAVRILGSAAAEVPPEHWSEHFGVYMPDKVTPYPLDRIPLVRAIRGEASSEEMFIRNPQRTGPGAWIEVHGSPLHDKDGVACGGVIAFRDITEKKATELEIRKLNETLEERIAERTRQLEVANQELEAFTYSVSHDLRAPLRRILGFAAACLEEFATTMDPRALHYVTRIQDGTRRMSVLTDELLNLARSGQKALRLQPVELSVVVDEIIHLLKGETEGRAVEWKVGSLPCLACDPVLVRQIFQNLLSNAIKYSRPREHAIIEIGHTREKGVPVFYVRDNGVGFKMQYAGKLFGVFQRLHRDEDFEGTGVGLATVARIVRRHGGRVWAEAEVDRGATFFFTLGGGDSGESQNDTVTVSLVATLPGHESHARVDGME